MSAGPPLSARSWDATVDARVRAERLQVLFRQAPPAILISVVVGAMVVAVLWDVVDSTRLEGWLAALVLLAIGRGAVVSAYVRRPHEGIDVRRWQAWFVGTALLVSLAWGIGGWILMPADSPAHQAMLYFFLMGLVAGTVATYGAHVRLVTSSIVLVILPATLRLFQSGSLELHLMALGGVIYTVAAFRATNLVAFFLHRSFRLSQELSLAHAREQELARTDDLTGMNNRRAFFELAEHALQHADRYDRAMSLILIDVDRFKTINDERGHAAGDDVLRTVAAIVRNTVRNSDVAGRLGGEEFAILLPETGAQAAMAMAERLRRGFAETPVRTGAGPVRFTASFGVAQREGSQGSVDTLVGRADAALYQAKREGRDRIRLSAAVALGGPRSA